MARAAKSELRQGRTPSVADLKNRLTIARVAPQAYQGLLAATSQAVAELGVSYNAKLSTLNAGQLLGKTVLDAIAAATRYENPQNAQANDGQRETALSRDYATIYRDLVEARRRDGENGSYLALSALAQIINIAPRMKDREGERLHGVIAQGVQYELTRHEQERGRRVTGLTVAQQEQALRDLQILREVRGLVKQSDETVNYDIAAKHGLPALPFVSLRFRTPRSARAAVQDGRKTMFGFPVLPDRPEGEGKQAPAEGRTKAQRRRERRARVRTEQNSVQSLRDLYTEPAAGDGDKDRSARKTRTQRRNERRAARSERTSDDQSTQDTALPYRVNVNVEVTPRGGSSRSNRRGSRGNQR